MRRSLPFAVFDAALVQCPHTCSEPLCLGRVPCNTLHLQLQAAQLPLQRGHGGVALGDCGVALGNDGVGGHLVLCGGGVDGALRPRLRLALRGVYGVGVGERRRLLPPKEGRVLDAVLIKLFL